VLRDKPGFGRRTIESSVPLTMTVRRLYKLLFLV
jgi:hypothetical protein